VDALPCLTGKGVMDGLPELMGPTEDPGGPTGPQSKSLFSFGQLDYCVLDNRLAVI
jgi:hypothetical protein